MLKFLGVSRSGYHSFLNRKISVTTQQKGAIKKNIRIIYDASKQNYHQIVTSNMFQMHGVKPPNL